MFITRFNLKKTALLGSLIFLIAACCFVAYVLSLAKLSTGGLQPVNAQMNALLQEQTMAHMQSSITPQPVLAQPQLIPSTLKDSGEPPIQLNPLINLNTATITQLVELPGIGEVKAKAIIEYREENGKFLEKEQITEVKGIGDKTYEKLKDQITVQ